MSNPWLRRPLIVASWLVGTTMLVVVGCYLPLQHGARGCRVRQTTPVIMYEVSGAIAHYAADHDRACPPSLVARIDGRYLTAMPRDTWRHAFRYRCDTRRASSSPSPS